MPSRVTDRPAPDRTAVRSRRAFARRQWARRWLTWRYLLLGLVLVALLAGVTWLFWFSSALAVRTVEVSGADRIGDSEVRAAADVPEGEQLARLDLDTLRARIEALADVRSATATRTWPDTVTVTVEERTPVAVVEIGGRLRGLDVDGVVFREFRSAPKGLPRVQTPADTGRDALLEAAAVVSALPEGLTRKVDHVEVATVDQISLELRDGRTVLWGSAEESEAKAEVLAALLEQPGSTYDVSVPGQPTVRD